MKRSKDDNELIDKLTCTFGVMDTALRKISKSKCTCDVKHPCPVAIAEQAIHDMEQIWRKK